MWGQDMSRVHAVFIACLLRKLWQYNQYRLKLTQHIITVGRQYLNKYAVGIKTKCYIAIPVYIMYSLFID
jgi:hypothetical protein